LGAYVSVGHKAIIHGCTIAARVLIGMQAVIMDGAELTEDTIQFFAGHAIQDYSSFLR